MIITAGPASAATVSDATIASAASAAGLGGCGGLSLGGWVAIALAESGGNVTAHATSGEDSRGLWQINMRAHASWVGSANLYDPAVNAWAAKHVCDIQGPSAWTVYGNGMYAQYLSRGAAAAAAIGSGSAAAVPTVAAASAATPTAGTTAGSGSSGGAGSSGSTGSTGSSGSTSAGTGRWTGGYHSVHGYKSSATRLVQQKLSDAGYRIAVDGVFGRRTDAAVKDYQANNALLVDGIVGPQTWGHMFG